MIVQWLLASIKSNSTLLNNLQAYYKFESNLNDSVWSNNWTGTSITYWTGIIWNSWIFNGTTSKVLLWTDTCNFTGSFTISVWVKFTSIGAYDVIFSNFNQSPSGIAWYWFICRINPSNQVEFNIYNDSQVLLSTTATVTTWTWYNIVFVRTSSTWSAIYINWTSSVTNSSTFNPSYPTYSFHPSIWALEYFAWSYLNDQYINWNIDELWIWTRALTGTEITELYNSWTWKTHPF